MRVCLFRLSKIGFFTVILTAFKAFPLIYFDSGIRPSQCFIFILYVKESSRLSKIAQLLCSTSINDNRLLLLIVIIMPQISKLTYQMKKIFSFMAIIAIVFASNCSRIPENNDPVIGIWFKVEIQTLSESSKQTIRQEWIFNDAYLGRYHRYNGNQLEFKTDFKWERADGNYTISYPGTDMPENVVSMIASSDPELLEDSQGNVLAQRE